jgi:predicted dithiol-disulfide oxidoreductase (DUF899 family)
MPESLVPAVELARRSPVRFPNESSAYRAARTALLAEEIDLRRHLERVAAQRRALPPGGEVTGDYRFEGERGPMSFADLFGDKQTLAVYSYMFGPERERPCPMCTNLLGAWEGNAADIAQRIALAVVARSPIDRLVAWKRERGWKNLPLFSIRRIAVKCFRAFGIAGIGCLSRVRASLRDRRLGLPSMGSEEWSGTIYSAS